MVCIYCMHMHKPLHGMSHTIVSKLLINFTSLFEVKIYCPEDAYHQLLEALTTKYPGHVLQPSC